MEGIENSPCQFPRWSKSASGRTSLSKLATWSRVVSHRRMSDPFPNHSVEDERSDAYSLSDDENSNPSFRDGTFENAEEMEDTGFDRDLCDDDQSTTSRDFEDGVPVSSSGDVTLEELGFERDLCDEVPEASANGTEECTSSVSGEKSSFVEQNFKVSLDQLCSIKQAIKRKYPGAEISQSFISSSGMEKCEGDSSQKRKLGLNLSHLKIKGVVSEINS